VGSQPGTLRAEWLGLAPCASGQRSGAADFTLRRHPRVEHTSSRAAFEAQKVRVSTRRNRRGSRSPRSRKEFGRFARWVVAPPSRHYSYLRVLRDPRLFLCVGFLAFWTRPGCGRTPISLAPNRSTGRPPRAKAASRETEPMTDRECLARSRMCDCRRARPKDLHQRAPRRITQVSWCDRCSGHALE
jgi:hypothetical protein